MPCWVYTEFQKKKKKILHAPDDPTSVARYARVARATSKRPRHATGQWWHCDLVVSIRFRYRRFQKFRFWFRYKINGVLLGQNP